MKDYENVKVINHPLIEHKVALLRDAATPSAQFRASVKEIAALMTYEACRDLPLVKAKIKTPLEETEQFVLQEDCVALILVLRAGLAMADGALTVLPEAKVGHIGLCRDEKTLLPAEYYRKLPAGIEKKTVLLLDPMLATGGSSCAAIEILKRAGCKKIKLLSIIAAPQGVKRVAAAHEDVQILLAALDRELNADGYILPGLGDAGDRIFGTD